MSGPNTRRLKRFLRNKLAIIGFALLVVLLAFCFLGPLFYHTEQVLTSLKDGRLKPGVNGHPLGTDDLGYDLLGRLMLGGQTSLTIGLAAGVLATMIGALAQNFEDYELWLANHGDMIVVAVPKGKLPRLDPAAFANPVLRAELDRLNIRNLDDLLMHRVGGKSVLGPYYALFGARPNSDFMPVLDLNAAYARFRREQVEDMPLLMEAPIPVLALFDRARMQQPDPGRLSTGVHQGLRRFALVRQAEVADAYLRTGETGKLDTLPPPLAADLMLVRAALIDCRIEVPAVAMAHATTHIAMAVDSHFARARREALWKRLSASGCRSAAAIRTWLALHAALAAEDGAGITVATSRLMQTDIGPDLVPYVVAAHMTGLLLRGEGQEAVHVFEEHRNRVGSGNPAWEYVVLDEAQGDRHVVILIGPSEALELQASLQQAQTQLQAQEVAIATHEGEFNALQNSQRLLHQKPQVRQDSGRHRLLVSGGAGVDFQAGRPGGFSVSPGQSDGGVEPLLSGASR